MTGKREKTAALSKGRQQGGLQKAALYFWKYKYLYLMLRPAILYYIIFCYVPMYGVTIAFKDFNFVDGMFGSDWMHPLFENFRFLFSSKSAIRAFVNTLVLNLIFIVMGVICEVGLALLLNEIRGKFFKKITQTFTLLPHG